MRGPLRSRPGNLVFWGIAALAVLVGAIMIGRSSTVAMDGRRYFALFDDAMISMRYADNLVSGRGLVWNPGERVEGFSNPLWVLVMAAAILAFGKLYAVLAMQVLGLALAIADLVLVAAITRRVVGPCEERDRDVAALGAVLLTSTFYPLFYWSIMGMETGLLTTLLLGAVLLSILPVTRRRRLAMAALLAAAAVTRPEAALFVAVLFGFELVRRGRAALASPRALAGEAAVLVAPAAAYLLFRRAYYGQWVPNTYFLKATGLPLAERLGNGLRFLAPFLVWTNWLVLGVAVFIAWPAADRRRTGAPATVAALAASPAGRAAEALALFAVSVGYTFAVGGDAWPLYVRFPAPATVLLIAAFAAAVTRGALGALPRRGPIAAAVVLGGASLLAGAWTLAIFRADLLRLTPIYSEDAARHVDTALALEHLTTDEAVVAPYFAGTICYYARRKALDPLGRMDPFIARLPPVRGVPWGKPAGMPGHNKYDLTYTFRRRRPTFIQWNGWPICTWGRQSLESWCRENYRLVNFNGVRLLLDKDSPAVRWDRIGARRL